MGDPTLADWLERDAEELGDIGGLGNVIDRMRRAAAALRAYEGRTQHCPYCERYATRAAELEAENVTLRNKLRFGPQSVSVSSNRADGWQRAGTAIATSLTGDDFLGLPYITQTLMGDVDKATDIKI